MNGKQTKPDSAAPGGDAQLPPMEAPMPTVADAEAAIDGALSDALKAVKVLYTMLRKVNLQGFAVADEVAASIVYAQKMRAALSAPKQVDKPEDDALYRMFRAIVDAGGPSTIARHGVERGGDEWADAVRTGLLAIEHRFHPERFDYDYSPQAALVRVEGEGPELPPRLALLPTQAEALTAADRALADAENAIKVLSTMLKNRQLQGYMVADEIWGSVKQARILIAGATPPPSQPAVELEQFRGAVDALWEKYSEYPPIREEAERLLALIDGAKAAPSPWRPINELPQTDDLFWFLRGDTVDGPRAPQIGLFDADQWDWFAPCKWPSTSSIIDGAKAGAGDTHE